MIKGVNKKIVEINNPDSIYFEKAVFYLRPNVRELPTEVSEAEAARYVSQLIPEYRKIKRSASIRRIALFSLLALAAVIAAVFMVLQ